jgi:hypothetical protein
VRGTFNRRHKRVGHLFQNRYKSILVEEEPYLLELVRYLHLNPLRAQAVPDLRTLDRYPWTGHRALLGRIPRPWQDTTTILAQFGRAAARARRAYRAFVAAGIPQGRRPELQGGGLLRSVGGWQAVAALRRGREAYLGDERILGSSEFVARIQRTLEPAATGSAARSRSRRSSLGSADAWACPPRPSPGAAQSPALRAHGRGSPTAGLRSWDGPVAP